jgi:UDP-glucose 4-epimerase
MNVLVTGGAGFIGSHLVEYFQGKATVRVLDNLRSGNLHNLDGLDCEFIEGSITDRAAVRAAVDSIDYVFHLAAMISVPESVEHPVECVEINTIGTLTVLEEAARAGVKKLCFSSSAANYGDNPVVPKVETMLPEPKSPYAVSKLSGEYFCDMFSRDGRLATGVMRCFNVFGPRQALDRAHAAVVPAFVSKALRNEPITVFGDGEQTRDFIYVKDIVAANVFLAMHDTEPGFYNVACGGHLTINDLAEKIIELTGSSSEIVHLPERAGDVKHSMASVDKIRTAGFCPVCSFDDELRETIAFYR